MPVNENKPASSLIVNGEQISQAELQNRFGIRHEVISNLTPGKFLTILAVETDAIVDGDSYSILESTLKGQFGVNALQTVFDAAIPEELQQGQQFNVYISGHLKVVLSE